MNNAVILSEQSESKDLRDVSTLLSTARKAEILRLRLTPPLRMTKGALSITKNIIIN
jgi:hypothetical protein